MKFATYLFAFFALIAVYFSSSTEAAIAPDMAIYNTKVGQEFLAEKKAEEGVTATASGLLYKVDRPGKGTAHPKATDTVKVHYRGTLISGLEFDSSYSRNSPISFPLNRVIPGWTEGVQLMTEGAKYTFYIPSELAYGTRGAGRDIGPNATLIFEVELLEISTGRNEL